MLVKNVGSREKTTIAAQMVGAVEKVRQEMDVMVPSGEL